MANPLTEGQTDFSGQMFEDAVFYDVDATGVNFSGCTFLSCVFASSTNFQNCTFINAHFDPFSASSAMLADFAGSIWSNDAFTPTGDPWSGIERPLGAKTVSQVAAEDVETQRRSRSIPPPFMPNLLDRSWELAQRFGSIFKPVI